MADPSNAAEQNAFWLSAKENPGTSMVSFGKGKSQFTPDLPD